MRILAALMLVLLVAACAGPRPDEASAERIAASVYVPPGPPKITVFTMVNNRTGSGGHTALMVSGSQQVIFDPAGSFQHPDIARRGDVMYGVTPGWVQAYKSAHARSTYHVVSQEFTVTPQQAETALALVRSRGAVPGSFCTNATSDIMRKIPGFEDVDHTWFPVRLMEQLETRPGVVTDRYYENDAGDVRDGIAGAQI
ncbi:hypothetical protein [uncultured Roseobacter sp.]|uniref:hypothetical protein n=1 Tax=uncultured Roseobacter sp. TaxID=114847 RepID=UPI00263400D0|nr:hypothetical protein [uncultured Roseobacter sp.]